MKPHTPAQLKVSFYIAGCDYCNNRHWQYLPLLTLAVCIAIVVITSSIIISILLAFSSVILMMLVILLNLVCLIFSAVSTVSVISGALRVRSH